MTSRQLERSPLPLFALLIGINDYASEHGRLKGAVADAHSFKNWLEGLGVPNEHIVLLINEAASYDAIIASLRKLKTDTRIRNGDPIFIYYAGHGTEIKAPDDWECGNSKGLIQAIVSYDCDSTFKSGERIPPIADRTFGALIGEISMEKGDNIFVIFDCCHSGSGTRSPTINVHDSIDEDLQITPRSLELDRDYTASLEKQIRDIRSPELSSVSQKFGHSAMKSHVFLSACSLEEKAYEIPVKGDPETTKRGRFSYALLKLFNAPGLVHEELRYSDILNQIERIPNQNPQCEGFNRGKTLFRSKIRPVQRKLFTIQSEEPTKDRDPSRYTINAGSIHKIAPQSEFALFRKSDVELTTKIGTLSVTEIGETSSVATIALESSADVPPESEIIALQTKSGRSDDLRIYIAPKDGFRSIYLCELWKSHHIDCVTLLEEPGEANIEISLVDCNQVDFILHFPIEIPDLLPNQWKQTVGIDPSDPEAFARILSSSASFYRELNPSASIPGVNVDVNFYQLKEKESRDLVPVEPISNLLQNGVISISHDSDTEIPYGIKLVNRTDFHFYVYVFFLEFKDLSISAWADTPVPNKNYSIDAPLKANETLAIGWGSAGFDPFSCVLDEGREICVDFLKIYLSTEPVDLLYLEQSSPFSDTLTRGIKKYKSPNAAKPKWTEMAFPIIQRRHRNYPTIAGRN